MPEWSSDPAPICMFESLKTGRFEPADSGRDFGCQTEKTVEICLIAIPRAA